jgi:hypothetical protein
MKNILKYLFLLTILSLTGCTGDSGEGAVTVKVKAVEQVENYTYLLVKGRGPAYWIAVSSTEITPGESITYEGGMLMENFHSEELDRTFERVLFLDAVEGEKAQAMDVMPGTSHGSAVQAGKLEIKVEQEKGTVSIAELYADPGAFEGKKIRVKGEVAKFNGAIMDRNWIHIQDGSEFEGKYDLTITSKESFVVGQVLSFEGTLTLNRDFGYGYTYEILLEQATALK